MHPELPADWPAPPSEALSLGEALTARIRAAMDAAGGAIPFSRYMELALYSPGLGYYSAGLRKFGAGGDFITAPETSPLFAQCLARPCRQVLDSLGEAGGDLLELGAGTGIMAADLLLELEGLGCLPGRYLILERSAELRDRQRHTLQEKCPHLLARVSWLDGLPAAGFRGVILGNEVVDALAVERFRWRDGQVWQLQVAWRDGAFVWQEVLADTQLEQEVRARVARYALPEDYTSELIPGLNAWVRGLADCLEKGLLLLVDYGYPGSEYYHPQRAGGSLMCHYRHRAHGDPLILTGLQDITAHVDFSALAEAGEVAGLSLAGFTTQAYFLLDAGLDQLLAAHDPSDQPAFLELTRQVKLLTLPGEMGERFKCLAMTRGINAALQGFRMQDFWGRL